MAIPIIGQPKIGLDWFVTFTVTCPCGQAILMAGQVGVTRACPCGMAYRLLALPVATPSGDVNWSIGVGAVSRPEPNTEKSE